jgi:hypothetical protein
MPSDLTPGDPSTICEERARLLREYSNAAGVYSNNVREMAELVMSGQERRVGECRQKCRTAWDQTEKCRLALYRHEADHQCDRGASVSTVSGK